MTSPGQEKVNQFENLIRTLMAVVLVGVMGWVGNNTQKSTVALVSIQKDIEYMTYELKEHDNQLSNMEDRISILERR